QSSRRSWRIGQDRPVRVLFLCQEGTMQTKCLRLMGKKLLVALTLEGKFASEGLHDIEDDDDMLAALARELVEKDGIGQTGAPIGSELKQIYDQLPANTQPSGGVDVDLPVLGPAEIPTFDEVPPLPSIPMVNMTQAELLMASALDTSTPTLFGQTLSPQKRKAKRRQDNVPQQGSLFSWN